MQIKRDKYLISTDKDRLDIHKIIEYLQEEAYWALGRSKKQIKKSIANSTCFGLYEKNKLIGFARVVTDTATFAYLCDVFIIKTYQGMGLGKWLIETIVKFLDEEGVAWTMLATRDAHGLYEEYGSFQKLFLPEKWMGRVNPKYLKSSKTGNDIPMPIV